MALLWSTACKRTLRWQYNYYGSLYPQTMAFSANYFDIVKLQVPINTNYSQYCNRFPCLYIYVLNSVLNALNHEFRCCCTIIQLCVEQTLRYIIFDLLTSCSSKSFNSNINGKTNHRFWRRLKHPYTDHK